MLISVHLHEEVEVVVLVAEVVINLAANESLYRVAVGLICRLGMLCRRGFPF